MKGVEETAAPSKSSMESPLHPMDEDRKSVSSISHSLDKPHPLKLTAN